VRLTNYLKTAFLVPWNLLAFGATVAFGVIIRQPDVVIPLALAAETAYLGLLGMHPKFQQYVDAQDAKQARVDGSLEQEQMLRQMVAALPRESMQRFEALRARCLELQQIAVELKRPSDGVRPLDDLQLEGLDRLLWIYLKLLFTQYSLERFFEKTPPGPIDSDIKRLDAKLKALPADATDPNQLKIRKAVEDNLQTSRDRLANLLKARQTYEILQLEVDRLENKIRSLSELAVNRQEPDFITGQVDQVASSMVETERTMNDLQFATGLHSFEDNAPSLLRRPPVKQVTKQR